MTTGSASTEVTFARGRSALRRVRNALQEALPVLAALEALDDTPDRIGTFTLQPDEPLCTDDSELIDFLELARAESPGQAITLTITTGPRATRKEGHNGQGAQEVHRIRR